ncbi:MAG TPA: RnfABCDGE type electron transport complex subunit B [Candidatus Fimenecus excrementigallinarum]|uniref:Ion-translocating oxidoreductase complex subunit B n=1 Tax=Candidatus Fimenecus excrementigallinarum TaxID=2840816 RepID=A0A9D1LDP4_9FIRM|nr:RnfABCDGE type electron transport complex subunit B [Candidatus Fimenecus excrementigallinarum]
MNTILLAVLLVAGIGLIAGVGLSVASVVMAVPTDETADAIREVLPGANCGACGFSGCDGYAAALSGGQTAQTNLCAPGGNDAAKAIAAILGVEAGEIKPMAAVVHCNGTTENSKQKLTYQGVQSCVMAAQLFGGQKECVYGCLGYGDCVRACPYDAISICDGVARVNPLACKACRACISACPKHLIELLPLYETRAAVLCKNHNKGAFTRKECTAGCIGCMKCTKVCEFDAIRVENNTAHVDYDKCTGCGKCAAQCPVGAIHLLTLAKESGAQAG